MIRRNLLVVLVFLGALMVVPVACEDAGGGYTDIQPVVNDHCVGLSEDPDACGTVQALPDDDRLQIDFGMVDLEKLVTRYFFLPNVGKDDLRVLSVAWANGASPAFQVACWDGLAFQPDCSMPTGYEGVGPGKTMVLQVSFVPVEVRAYQDAVTLNLNTLKHKSLAIDLVGEGVTPEIEVCITDCTGDEGGLDCVDPAAELICNTDLAQGGRLQIVFGDDSVGAAHVREVVIRNLGKKQLKIEDLNIRKNKEGEYWNLYALDGNNVFSKVSDWQFEPKFLDAAGAQPAEAVFKVQYGRRMGGEHPAMIQLITDDANEREIFIEITGSTLAPRLCPPDPPLVNFGTIATGEVKVESFSFKNCGTLPLVVDKIEMETPAPNDFSLPQAPLANITLAADETLEVQVQYHPLDNGSDADNVLLYSNDPMSQDGLTGRILVQGGSQARACELEVVPWRHNFGKVLQNTTDTVEFVIANDGNDDCILSDVLIEAAESAGGDFAIVPGTKPGPLPLTMAIGDRATVTVKYTPSGIGVDAGILTVLSNDNDSPDREVPLDGEGVATAQCDVEMSGLSDNMMFDWMCTINPQACSDMDAGKYLNFGTVKLNTNQSRILTITNKGNADCIFEPIIKGDGYFGFIKLPGDFTIKDGSAGFVVKRQGQPGDTVEIEVVFAPKTKGSEFQGWHMARMWLHTNDDPDFTLGTCTKPGVIPPQMPANGDACISLNGMTDESDIEVVPSKIDFGLVTIGCASPQMKVTVYNLGGIDLNIDDIYLEDATDPSFEILSKPPTPYVLGGGKKFEVLTRYRPQGEGTNRSALYIESDASNVQTLVVPLLGRGTWDSSQTDVFQQPDRVKADILYVIDNSSSMGWVQDALADNFSYFINWATTLDVDFQIGVLAMQVDEPAEGGTPKRQIVPGVLNNAPNRPKILSNGTPDLVNAFKENIRVGTCCADAREAGFEPAWDALTPPLSEDPATNFGFLRTDAKLYIICISDADDQSKGNPAFYVDAFSSIKGYRNTEWMKVSAIVPPDPAPQECPIEDQAPSYHAVQQQTGGIFRSICTDDWAQSMGDMGIDAFDYIREWGLSRPADVSSLVVTVDGVPVPAASCGDCKDPACADGWVFYPSSNSVCFGANVVPEKNSVVSISYETVCY